eukprot:TRINITY_DN992_c0_g1_i1.p1 TRINITY_DN992_c0_g1~~TRINITY_DN992_c0_g1_i1.p1  ORF type:complete len:2823 (+),score=494.74 TRINITY_DN992_c0_g1_i1:142-8610(+)
MARPVFRTASILSWTLFLTCIYVIQATEMDNLEEPRDPYYGSAKDGAVTASGSYYPNSLWTTLTSAVEKFATTVTVASASGLSVGDEIFLIQSLVSGLDEKEAGRWEMQTIQAINGNALTVYPPSLRGWPSPGSYRSVAVCRVPNYSNLTVTGTMMPTTRQYNTGMGGILVIRVNDTLDIQSGGAFNGVDKGFPYFDNGGGSGYCGRAHVHPLCGAGCYGLLGNDGGDAGCNGGGGAGFTNGNNGYCAKCYSACGDCPNAVYCNSIYGYTPGGVVSFASYAPVMSRLAIGVAGGSGADDNDGDGTAHGGRGGHGGGSLMIFARKIKVGSGTAKFETSGSGATSGSQSNNAEAGGGGGGGAGVTYIQTEHIDVTSWPIASNNGGGAGGGYHGAGGHGGVGASKINCKTINGADCVNSDGSKATAFNSWGGHNIYVSTEDRCPFDAEKEEPGRCGCHVPEPVKAGPVCKIDHGQVFPGCYAEGDSPEELSNGLNTTCAVCLLGTSTSELQDTINPPKQYDLVPGTAFVPHATNYITGSSAVPGTVKTDGWVGVEVTVKRASGITLFQAGVFDDNQDGLREPLTWQLWTKSQDASNFTMMVEHFFSATEGPFQHTLSVNTRAGVIFKELERPIHLPIGTTIVIAVKGYTGLEMYADQTVHAFEEIAINTIGDINYGGVWKWSNNDIVFDRTSHYSKLESLQTGRQEIYTPVVAGTMMFGTNWFPPAAEYVAWANGTNATEAFALSPSHSWTTPTGDVVVDLRRPHRVTRLLFKAKKNTGHRRYNFVRRIEVFGSTGDAFGPWERLHQWTTQKSTTHQAFSFEGTSTIARRYYKLRVHGCNPNFDMELEHVVLGGLEAADYCGLHACLADGVCVPNGQTNPQNPCLECNITANPLGWTIDDTNPCHTGAACATTGHCHYGVCQDGFTTIDVANGTVPEQSLNTSYKTVAHDFDVIAPEGTLVTHLGLIDTNMVAGTLYKVKLWNREAKSVMASETLAFISPGTRPSAEGTRWNALVRPVLLPKGFKGTLAVSGLMGDARYVEGPQQSLSQYSCADLKSHDWVNTTKKSVEHYIQWRNIRKGSEDASIFPETWVGPNIWRRYCTGLSTDVPSNGTALPTVITAWPSPAFHTEPRRPKPSTKPWRFLVSPHFHKVNERPTQGNTGLRNLTWAPRPISRFVDPSALNTKSGSPHNANRTCGASVYGSALTLPCPDQGALVVSYTFDQAMHNLELVDSFMLLNESALDNGGNVTLDLQLLRNTSSSLVSIGRRQWQVQWTGRTCVNASALNMTAGSGDQWPNCTCDPNAINTNHLDQFYLPLCQSWQVKNVTFDSTIGNVFPGDILRLQWSYINDKPMVNGTLTGINFKLRAALNASLVNTSHSVVADYGTTMRTADKKARCITTRRGCSDPWGILPYPWAFQMTRSSYHPPAAFAGLTLAEADRLYTRPGPLVREMAHQADSWTGATLPVPAAELAPALVNATHIRPGLGPSSNEQAGYAYVVLAFQVSDEDRGPTAIEINKLHWFSPANVALQVLVHVNKKMLASKTVGANSTATLSVRADLATGDFLTLTFAVQGYDPYAIMSQLEVELSREVTDLKGPLMRVAPPPSCQIDGKCYTEGANNPENECLYCDTKATSTFWSFDDNTVCGVNTTRVLNARNVSIASTMGTCGATHCWCQQGSCVPSPPPDVIAGLMNPVPTVPDPPEPDAPSCGESDVVVDAAWFMSGSNWMNSNALFAPLSSVLRDAFTAVESKFGPTAKFTVGFDSFDSSMTMVCLAVNDIDRSVPQLIHSLLGVALPTFPPIPGLPTVEDFLITNGTLELSTSTDFGIASLTISFSVNDFTLIPDFMAFHSMSGYLDLKDGTGLVQGVANVWPLGDIGATIDFSSGLSAAVVILEPPPLPSLKEMVQNVGIPTAPFEWMPIFDARWFFSNVVVDLGEKTFSFDFSAGAHKFYWIPRLVSSTNMQGSVSMSLANIFDGFQFSLSGDWYAAGTKATITIGVDGSLFYLEGQWEELNLLSAALHFMGDIAELLGLPSPNMKKIEALTFKDVYVRVELDISSKEFLFEFGGYSALLGPDSIFQGKIGRYRPEGVPGGIPPRMKSIFLVGFKGKPNPEELFNKATESMDLDVSVVQSLFSFFPEGEFGFMGSMDDIDPFFDPDIGLDDIDAYYIYGGGVVSMGLRMRRDCNGNIFCQGLKILMGPDFNVYGAFGLLKPLGLFFEAGFGDLEIIFTPFVIKRVSFYIQLRNPKIEIGFQGVLDINFYPGRTVRFITKLAFVRNQLGLYAEQKGYWPNQFGIPFFTIGNWFIDLGVTYSAPYITGGIGVSAVIGWDCFTPYGTYDPAKQCVRALAQVRVIGVAFTVDYLTYGHMVTSVLTRHISKYLPDVIANTGVWLFSATIDLSYIEFAYQAEFMGFPRMLTVDTVDMTHIIFMNLMYMEYTSIKSMNPWDFWGTGFIKLYQDKATPDRGPIMRLHTKQFIFTVLGMTIPAFIVPLRIEFLVSGYLNIGNILEGEFILEIRTPNYFKFKIFTRFLSIKALMHMEASLTPRLTYRWQELIQLKFYFEMTLDMGDFYTKFIKPVNDFLLGGVQLVINALSLLGPSLPIDVQAIYEKYRLYVQYASIKAHLSAGAMNGEGLTLGLDGVFAGVRVSFHREFSFVSWAKTALDFIGDVVVPFIDQLHYFRGIGSPWICDPSTEDMVWPLCFKKCPRGYHTKGPFCVRHCRSGYRLKAGFVCYRGPAAKKRSKCKVTGVRCCGGCSGSGFRKCACWCCRPPSVYVPRIYIRRVRPVHRCPTGKEKFLFLCYPKCRRNYGAFFSSCFLDPRKIELPQL